MTSDHLVDHVTLFRDRRIKRTKNFSLAVTKLAAISPSTVKHVCMVMEMELVLTVK